MVDNINGNLTKICFYKLYINVNIIQNLSIKLISKLITKLGKLYINFYKPFFDIFSKKNYCIWTVID